MAVRMKYLAISVCWFIRLNNEFVFPGTEPPTINVLYGRLGIYGQFLLLSFISSFITSWNSIIFLYWFFIWLNLISSFSLSRFLLVPHVYVSIESIYCILLLPFECNAKLLISSVKTLFLSLFCICNIDLLFLMNFLWIFKIIFVYFLVDILFYYQFELLLNSFLNFQIHVSCLLLFCFHCCSILNSYLFFCSKSNKFFPDFST